MKYNPNIWTIAFAVLILAGVVVAGTQYFDNKADALTALDKGITLIPADCTILSVEETITTGNLSGNIVATVQMAFNKPEYDRRIGKQIVSSTVQTIVERESEPMCESLWAGIQAEPQFQTIDTVVVEYDKGILASIKNRKYDVGKNSWSNISQLQP